MAYGLGQSLGGGGLLAVFVAGVWLSNGRYRLTRFDQHALHKALHPFHNAAELSLLLLLGVTVAPAELITVLPLGLLLALVDVLLHPRGIPAATAETLGGHLLAVIFEVVLIDLVLQSLVMQQLTPKLLPAAAAEAG